MNGKKGGFKYHLPQPSTFSSKVQQGEHHGYCCCCIQRFARKIFPIMSEEQLQLNHLICFIDNAKSNHWGELHLVNKLLSFAYQCLTKRTNCKHWDQGINQLKMILIAFLGQLYLVQSSILLPKAVTHFFPKCSQARGLLPSHKMKL